MTNIDTDIDRDILRDYARAQSTVAPGEPLTFMLIGRDRTTSVSRTDDAAYDAIALNIGLRKQQRNSFSTIRRRRVPDRSVHWLAI